MSLEESAWLPALGRYSQGMEDIPSLNGKKCTQTYKTLLLSNDLFLERVLAANSHQGTCSQYHQLPNHMIWNHQLRSILMPSPKAPLARHRQKKLALIEISFKRIELQKHSLKFDQFVSETKCHNYRTSHDLTNPLGSSATTKKKSHQVCLIRHVNMTD